ncbi:creatininase (creatinine amidohydrolase) protein (plasmid) [Agrobacterium tumefaciens F2]|jgi:creatinine amidohydrolase|nr:creatininase (creatinine amidohydrolase) protein [Agrobacterium tumefaciens F2]
MSVAKRFYWEERTTLEFDELAAQDSIAILPVAATEQHGPHLSVATDSAIGRGMLECLRERIPGDISVSVLPLQAVGKSNEHHLAPGTLTLPTEALIASWLSLGECVHRAGLRKMLIVNSHGGNNPVMDIVARELRVKLTMLVVTTQWNRFGFPDGAIDDTERRYGVHAGKAETSLMLHFRPDLVRMSNLKNFVSASASLEESFTHLRATAQHNMAWLIHDLNPDGAVGNAAAGTAAVGKAIAEHQVDGLVELLRDMKEFDLDRLVRTLPGSSTASLSQARLIA